MAARLMRSTACPTRHTLLSSTMVFPAVNPTSSFRDYSQSKTVISTSSAPGAIGPYSQAIKANNTIYVSGQLGLAPGTNDFPPSTNVKLQTSARLDHVVKTTVLLEDMASFADVNEVYASYFPKDPPARAAYAVKTLPKGAKVEIEAIAVVSATE